MNKLKKETNDAAIKGIRNVLRLKKENKAIKDKIVIRNLFEHEEEDYYKPIRVDNFWSNNYIEFKSKGDRYLNKIRPYLKDIINDLKKPSTWKIQLKITINFISFKDDNDEEHVKYLKRDKDFCNVTMPSEDTKMLELNQYQKSDKAPFVISADLECLIEKIDECKYNP